MPFFKFNFGKSKSDPFDNNIILPNFGENFVNEDFKIHIPLPVNKSKSNES